MNTTHWTLLVIVAVLTGIGLCWVLNRVFDGLERAWNWLRRDRVAEVLEDDDISEELTRLGLPPNHDWDPDCRVAGCPVHGNWLPPERTWEQMTSHQLPLLLAEGPEDSQRFLLQLQHSNELTAVRERRPPEYETEARAHYVAMGFDYPSGLMARVREGVR